MPFNIKNFDSWKDKFKTQSVQNDKGTYSADFLSSESVVMFSGPASLTDTTGYSNMVPIGLVQNVQVSQQKQLNQLFEIGSRKPYFVPGRTMVSGGIARVLFDGPSLMYAMSIRDALAGENKVKLNPEVSSGWPVKDISNTADNPTSLGSATSQLGGSTEATLKTTVESQPAPGYFFVNLASSFFNLPTGVGFALYDMEGQVYGGFYMENCYIQAHTFSVAAQQTVLVENVSFRATSISPIEVSSLGAA